MWTWLCFFLKLSPSPRQGVQHLESLQSCKMLWCYLDLFYTVEVSSVAACENRPEKSGTKNKYLLLEKKKGTVLDYTFWALEMRVRMRGSKYSS